MKNLYNGVIGGSVAPFNTTQFISQNNNPGRLEISIGRQENYNIVDKEKYPTPEKALNDIKNCVLRNFDLFNKTLSESRNPDSKLIEYNKQVLNKIKSSEVVNLTTKEMKDICTFFVGFDNLLSDVMADDGLYETAKAGLSLLKIQEVSQATDEELKWLKLYLEK